VLEDGGQAGQEVGCGDSAVPVQVVVPHTQGVLRAALEALLSIQDQYYGESGLYCEAHPHPSSCEGEEVPVPNAAGTAHQQSLL
jgi:hypothetical protein